MKIQLRILRFVCLLVLFLGIQASAQNDSASVETLPVEPVLQWTDLVYRLIEVEGINPANAARFYAYAGISSYEALVNGMSGNNSLAGQIWHMPDMPLPDDDEAYDWLTVHNVVMSEVLTNLFINASEETYAGIDSLYETQLEERESLFDEKVMTHSIELGREIARELVDWIGDDGYADTRGLDYEIPSGDGYWEVTTEGAAVVEPYWGQIRPFILDYADVCAIYPDIPYSTDEDSTFYQQAMEVVNTQRNLTQEQEDIALFWVDTPSITGTPAGHWWAIAGQVVVQLEMPLNRVAEVYAMLGIALGDSFISAWSLKYQVNLVRPVTYIRANIRRNWSPYIESPGFPEYPSGHSVVSGAAWIVLTRMLGPVAFTDETHIIYGHEQANFSRTFYSFEQAATEAAISRLYGGIHYRSAIENGVRQGECVGNYTMNAIRLNPVRQGE